MSKVRIILWIIYATCRRPPTLKAGWTLVAAWAIATVPPVLSVALNPVRGLDLSIWVGWSNLISFCIDVPMLVLSTRGLLWFYKNR